MISAMKKLNAHDLRVHFLKAALFWRKETRHYESKGNHDLATWCRGRRIEALDAIRWIRGMVG